MAVVVLGRAPVPREPSDALNVTGKGLSRSERGRIADQASAYTQPGASAAGRQAQTGSANTVEGSEWGPVQLELSGSIRMWHVNFTLALVYRVVPRRPRTMASPMLHVPAFRARDRFHTSVTTPVD